MMDRKGFLRRLGIGIAAIPLVPKILAEMPAPKELVVDGSKANWMEYDERLYEAYGDRDIGEVLEIYRETGDLIYKSNMKFDLLRVHDVVVRPSEVQVEPVAYLVIAKYHDYAEIRPLLDAPDTVLLRGDKFIIMSNSFNSLSDDSR